MLFLHFNCWTGPEIFISLPDEIPEKISKKVRKIFDIDISEDFFEIMISQDNIKITNMYLEIPSPWGRGNVEMTMLSVITDKDYDNEYFHEILNEYSHKIISMENIYKSFYEDHPDHYYNKEILPKKEELNQILLECFEHLKSKSEIEGGKIIQKFKRLQW